MMPIVMAEFERRRAAKCCEQSREAEAKALAEWLRMVHPDTQIPTPKTIRNKLPADFQPRSKL